MKLRLTQPGFDTYTGQMGTVFFENGLSTADVKPNDAVRMAAQFLCEWEDGSTASVAQSLLDHAHMTVGDLKAVTNADQAFAQQAAEAGALASKAAAEDGVTKTYTEESLAAIADKSGIKGLRVIAEPMGIKGNAIADLVRAILEKQGA